MKRAFLLLITSSSLCSFAQQHECTHVLLPLNILEASSNQKKLQHAALRAEDLIVKIDKQAVAIGRVRREDTLKAAVLLIDHSASMAGPDRIPAFSVGHPVWPIATSVARGILNSLPAGSDSEVLSFADKIRVDAPFGTSRAGLEAALDKVLTEHPKGFTALWEAVQEATADLSSRGGGVIFIVTDGGWNKGKAFKHELVRSMIEGRVRMFVFLVSSGDWFPEESGGATDLRKAAKQTGGTYFELAAEKQIGKAESQKISELTSFDVGVASKHLLLDVSRPESAARWSPVEILLPRKLPHIELLFPHELPPCTSHP